MQLFFNLKIFFFPNRFKNRKLRAFEYIYKSITTIFLLSKKRPRIVWFQLPPTPLIVIGRIYKSIYPGAYILADCHNAIISNKWKPYFHDYKSLNIFDTIVVHNYVIEDIIKKYSINEEKLIVLETKPAIKTIKNIKKDIRQNHVLMPCSFHEDEPLNIVFEAANLVPQITILISGDTSKAKGIHDLSEVPKNVKFIGYLSISEYETVFNECEAVIGLTTEDHIQLSVANEAVGFEKPMIISDTPLLRSLFYKGAVYVDTFNAKSIANGINDCILNNNKLQKDINALKKERAKRWENQARQIQERIEQKIKN